MEKKSNMSTPVYSVLSTDYHVNSFMANESMISATLHSSTLTTQHFTSSKILGIIRSSTSHPLISAIDYSISTNSMTTELTASTTFYPYSSMEQQVYSSKTSETTIPVGSYLSTTVMQRFTNSMTNSSTISATSHPITSDRYQSHSTMMLQTSTIVSNNNAWRTEFNCVPMSISFYVLMYCLNL
jgi:hypothetical protein